MYAKDGQDMALHAPNLLMQSKVIRDTVFTVEFVRLELTAAKHSAVLTAGLIT